MATLQDIFNLAKADGGKFFVIDETGEPKLVILDIEEYEKLLLGKIKQGIEDVEEVNREILEAQLEEQVLPAPVVESKLKPENFRAKTSVQTTADLREEVIDPSFDFEGPKIELEDL